MGWVRCLVISEESIHDKVLKALESNYKYIHLHRLNGFDLFAYEGRILADLDSNQTLTMGVDGRNPIYYLEGTIDYANIFNASIEAVCGLSTKLSVIKLALKDGKIKTIIKNLQTSASEVYSSEDEDVFNLRFDINPMSEPFDTLMNNLALINDIFMQKDWPIFTARFDNGFGQSDGTIDEPYEGCYVGPSAYAGANWVIGGTNFDLTLNDSESLLDGNTIDELS